MREMTLSAQHLAYGHPGRTLGRDINLIIKAGEVCCVLGPNGGGKTTLFRTLLGLIPKHSGEILLAGHRLQDLTPPQRARLVASVPQASQHYLAFSVRDIVLMGRTAHGGLFAAPTTQDHHAVDVALAECRITQLAEKLFSHLSAGERQLVLIARALAQAAPLLVMDEPTASLDLGNQALIRDELLRLKASGRSVLFSSHNPDHALQCADQVLLLLNGNVLAMGKTADVVTAENLKILYGVDVPQYVPAQRS